MKRELRKSDRLLHATFLEKRFSKKRNGRRLNHVWLDLFGQHADYLNVIQSPYETRARNARTLLDGLTVGKSASSVKPLIHQQKKFNKNLFEQKIAHFEGKGLLILPSSLSTSERSLQHDSESIRSAIYVGLAWVLRGSCVGLKRRSATPVIRPAQAIHRAKARLRGRRLAHRTTALYTTSNRGDLIVKRSRAYQRRSRIFLVALTVLAGSPLLLGVAAPAAYAQAPAKISNQQLDSLTAPIALYPDALLAQVLMASTFAQDVPAAAAWSKANPNLKGDDAVKAVAAEPWDPSVQSLVAFPQVLATMASKPDWVAQLGNAFLAQPNDVMDSVQRLRKQAQQAGNLQTNQQQKVVVEQSTIQIVPVNPQVVYVPTYNPTVVYGTWPYPAYPPVYVPPPPGYAVASGLAAGLAFGVGVAITSSLWSNVNWNNHSVNINVNQYNNINVNRRLDVNSSTTNWNRNSTFNRNTSANVGSAQRDAYRGRDMSASRAQAQQTLQNRTGQNLGGTASQRLQGIQQGGNNAANLRNNAQNVNRDNALRGAGDGGAAKQDMQRGQASRQSLANNRSGGPGANGGAQQRGGNLGAGGSGERAGLGAGGGGQPRGGGFGAGGGGQQRGGGLGAGGGGQRHFGRQH